MGIKLKIGVKDGVFDHFEAPDPECLNPLIFGPSGQLIIHQIFVSTYHMPGILKALGL